MGKVFVVLEVPGRGNCVDCRRDAVIVDRDKDGV